MTLALPDLDTLDATDVANNLATTVEAVTEDNTDLDLRPGVLFSILAYYHSLLATQEQALINLYLSARSLLDIEANPALADPTLVDAVISNYNLTRLPKLVVAPA